MALSPQDRYARAVARAKAAGFASPYEQRKARAKAAGFTSPRAQRTASEQARGIKRDYAIERENADRRARARGFDSAKQQRQYRNTPGSEQEKTLAFFGLTKYEFDKMRRQNRHYQNEYAQLQHAQINTYDMDRNDDIHNWSVERVGYIAYFNAAVVNPATNYESVAQAYTRPNGKVGHRMNLKGATKEQRQAQFRYLVQYSGYMSVSEFEARYGGVL